MAGKSRTRTPREVREQVEALAAARDALDAAQAERRKREDAAFERYAQCAVEASAITEERDAALAELDRQRERVESDTSARLASVEDRRAEVLSELNADGRSAEDLATMFAMPVKRVRTMLRATKAASTGGEPSVPADGRSQLAADSTAGDADALAETRGGAASG